MTLEERAEYIACARSIRGVPGGTVHNKIRDRALQQLREVAEAARAQAIEECADTCAALGQHSGTNVQPAIAQIADAIRKLR